MLWFWKHTNPRGEEESKRGNVHKVPALKIRKVGGEKAGAGGVGPNKRNRKAKGGERKGCNINSPPLS